MSMHPRLQLSDYRRSVSDLYASVRARWNEPEAAWAIWREGRDQLFGTHPQSALAESDRRAFSGLRYFPYDPSFRCLVDVESDGTPSVLEVSLDEDGMMRLVRIGEVRLPFADDEPLSLFWVLGYGGGLFLPFRDATNGGETFGGGRYLVDTIKGADLGWEKGRMILDFNFSYNPSCAYSPQWHCPLPPAENWLSRPIPVAERSFVNSAGGPVEQ